MRSTIEIANNSDANCTRKNRKDVLNDNLLMKTYLDCAIYEKKKANEKPKTFEKNIEWSIR